MLDSHLLKADGCWALGCCAVSQMSIVRVRSRLLSVLGMRSIERAIGHYTERTEKAQQMVSKSVMKFREIVRAEPPPPVVLQSYHTIPQHLPENHGVRYRYCTEERC